MKYGGCYKTSKVSIKETRTDNYNNNNECITFCDELGFKIIATSGEKCYCLEKSPSPQDDVEGCDKRCPDSLIEGSFFFFFVFFLTTTTFILFLYETVYSI